MKYTLCCSLLIASFALSASAQERIVQGDFKDATAGSSPPAPWSVSSKTKKDPNASVKIEPLPGGNPDRMWAHIADASPEVPAGILQSFEETVTGRFTAKLHFKKVGTAFGIYLGTPKVSGPDTRTIDVKILTDGVLTTAIGTERTRHDFQFTEGKTYDLYIKFKKSEDGSIIAYSVGVDGKFLAKGKPSADIPIAGLRITTDSADEGTDVYVTDISLVAAD